MEVVNQLVEVSVFTCLAVYAFVPAFDVIVCAHGTFVGCPRCWWNSGAVNPVDG